MYCRICGKEINDQAVICPHCGCATKETPIQPTRSKQLNVLSLLGFIFSLVSLLIALFGSVALAGLICSILGLVQTKNNTQQFGKGFAIAGICVSVGSLAYTVYVVMIYYILLMGV